MRQASSAVGVMIQCGRSFVEDTIQQEFILIVKEALRGDAPPRVILSYALPLWFTAEGSN